MIGTSREYLQGRDGMIVKSLEYFSFVSVTSRLSYKEEIDGRE